MAKASRTAVSTERSDFPVIIERHIAWGDMDAYDHVNNVVFLYYMESGRMSYFDHLGVTELMNDQKLGPILAEITCTYLAPLVYPDCISIGTRVERLGHKSFVMHQAMWSDKGHPVATAIATCVYMDYGIGKPIAVPVQLTEGMKKLEGGRI